MLDDSSLPSDTAILLREVAARDDLDGFTLIGGTALALRYGHRVSEDIDLAWHSGRLPRRRIDTLLRDLATGHEVRDAMSRVDREEYEDSGLELDDHQQDWSVAGVKLTFFAPEAEEAALIAGTRPEMLDRLVVAGDDLLFALKSRLLYKRVASRDLFDIWYLVDRRGRRLDDVLAQLMKANPHVGPEALLSRLTPTRFPSTDPGFETTLEGAPSTREDLLERMGDLVATHQRNVARNIALQAMRGR